MVKLVSERISIDEVLAAVENPSTGAVALFLGRVRDHAEGRDVHRMDYQAYPEMAIRKMQEIADEVVKRWSTQNIALVHRTGNLGLGDVSVVVAVACAHRKEAFAIRKVFLFPYRYGLF